MSARRSLLEYSSDEDKFEEPSLKNKAQISKDVKCTNSAKYWRLRVIDSFKYFGIFHYAVCGALFVIAWTVFWHLPTVQQESALVTKRSWKEIAGKLYSSMGEKKRVFPNQNEKVWFQIIASFKGLVEEPQSPAVYLLLYDDESLLPSHCMIEIITTWANGIFQKNSGWLLLNGSSLLNSRTNDSGILIETISSAIKGSKIIVITDINSIPCNLAKGFHFLVDEFNPKVTESVYIFTLKTPKKINFRKPVQIAESILKESWKALDNDTLFPLVTRITVQVLPILPEKKPRICSLKTSNTVELNIT